MNSYAFWEMHGAELPKLRALAMKVLAQPCTSSACERNWSTYEFIHTKKRNKLTSQRCNDLVFAFSNLRLANKLRDCSKRECVVEWEADSSSESEDEAEDEDHLPGTPITGPTTAQPAAPVPVLAPMRAAVHTADPAAGPSRRSQKRKALELQARNKSKLKK